MSEALIGSLESQQSSIPIADLGVEQLNFLLRQVEQEIEFLLDSLKELKLFEAKFASSQEAVNDVAKLSQNKEILVPLTESMFVAAKVADPSKHLVEIGTGYFAEMSTASTVNFFNRKQAYLKKQMDVIEELLPEKYRTRSVLTDNLQRKIRETLIQQPDANNSRK